MFCEVQAAKHCSKKINFSQPQSSRNTVMLKKFQTFRVFSSGLAIDARVLEFLEFFEHYSVS